MHSYHQGDINFYPLSLFNKSADDVSRKNMIRTTPHQLLIQEGEITGHHHGIWFMPQPVALRESGSGSGGNGAAAAAAGVLAKAVRGDLAPARLYADAELVASLRLDAGSPVVGFLIADEAVIIRHATREGSPTGEHGDIRLPAGGYLVTGKREWTAGDERRVQD